MLKLSDLLIYHKEIQTFAELIPIIQGIAGSGERFFRIDIKPPFPDTPNDWEDRVEAAFSGLIR